MATLHAVSNRSTLLSCTFHENYPISNESVVRVYVINEHHHFQSEPFLIQVSEIEVRVDGDDESLLLPLTVGVFVLLPLTVCPCPCFGPVRRGSFIDM